MPVKRNLIRMCESERKQKVRMLGSSVCYKFLKW